MINHNYFYIFSIFYIFYFNFYYEQCNIFLAYCFFNSPEFILAKTIDVFDGFLKLFIIFWIGLFFIFVEFLMDYEFFYDYE